MITEHISTLAIISAMPEKEATRIIPIIYASSMFVPNVQVSYDSSFEVGAVSNVPVGAVMLVTDPTGVTCTEAVLPDSSTFEETLITLQLLPVEEGSGKVPCVVMTGDPVIDARSAVLEPAGAARVIMTV